MRFRKSVLTGILALSTIIGAGAASAASYTVKSNDTLYLIANRSGVGLSSLIKANPQLSDPNAIWSELQQYFPGASYSPPSNPKPTAPTSNPKPTAPTSNPKPTVPTSNPAPTVPTSNPVPTVPTSNPAPTVSTTSVSSYANQVVSLVNKERANAGLSALASDSSLTSMALAKAKDMYNNNYFSHTSPTYGSPFAMMTAFGIKYSYAGENIAMGQKTPQEVMTAWMNSSGHRQNILSPNFAKIGVAYYNGEWVQEFTK